MDGAAGGRRDALSLDRAVVSLLVLACLRGGVWSGSSRMWSSLLPYTHH